MVLYIALDDTDTLDSIGTGRLAREIAGELAKEYPVYAVTRHQLYVHPDIPYTSHNSCAVIHLHENGSDIRSRLTTRVGSLMKERFVEGSDPGLAIARTSDITPATFLFGFDAKQRVVTQDQARTIARNARIPLIGLGGTEGGVIGALAGVALAASGSDGRFLHTGTIREFSGSRTIESLRAAGISEIHSVDGEPIVEGFVEIQKFPQPVCIRGQPVLFVERIGSTLRSVKRD
jgi:hypothetical protein